MTDCPSLRVLAYVNHYYGPAARRTPYRSNGHNSERRRGYVQNTIAALKSFGELPEVKHVEVRVCGIRGKSLVPVDVDFSFLEDPRQLVFESISEMMRHVDDYDYFINIEDDLLLPVETFRNVLEFDVQSMANEILHPNRIEIGNGRKLALDPVSVIQPRVWTFQEKQFKGIKLRVAVNPHSGILIMSQAKVRYCLKHTDIDFRGHVMGSGMESAFAHFHKPFSLYRPHDNLDFHVLIHQDRHHPYWSKWDTLKCCLSAGGLKNCLRDQLHR